MARGNGAFIPIITLFLLFSAAAIARGEGSEGPERAVVQADSLAVHAIATASGKVKKNFKKGDVVLVDAEITDSDGMAWCGVRGDGDDWMVGFVLCQRLERSQPAQSEKWRALPSSEEPAPPPQKPQVAPPAPPTPAQPPAEPPKSTGTPPASPSLPQGDAQPKPY